MNAAAAAAVATPVPEDEWVTTGQDPWMPQNQQGGLGDVGSGAQLNGNTVPPTSTEHPTQHASTGANTMGSIPTVLGPQGVAGMNGGAHPTMQPQMPGQMHMPSSPHGCLGHGVPGFQPPMSMGCIHLFHRLWQHMRYHMYILVLNIGIHKYPMEFLPKYIHMDIQLCHGQ